VVEFDLFKGIAYGHLVKGPIGGVEHLGQNMFLAAGKDIGNVAVQLDVRPESFFKARIRVFVNCLFR
jgi:hypothetical protein